MYSELNYCELPLLSFFEKEVLCSEPIKPSMFYFVLYDSLT